ncbi:uncharacterized protein LOC144925328 [Branchiostoma floridae x Branchiostoma belcheri]
MESDPEKKRKKKRRCSVCRLPVKGHPGPYGRGRCTFERPEGTSDEDFFGRQRGSANVQEKIRGLRRHSKVPELVRKAWSDSLSEDAEEEVRLARSYNLKKSSDYGGEKASVRARSEPPPQVSRQNARDPSRAYAQVKDQPDIRDLRESRKLVKEVDKALDDWLHPVTSQERRISDKRLDESDFDSTSTSSQTESGRSSDTEESAYTRKPERRRRRKGSRKKKTEARDPPQTLSSDTTESESGFVRKPDKRKRRRGSRKKKTEARDPPQTLSSDTTESELGFVRKPDKRKRRRGSRKKRSATRVGGRKKEKGKRSRRNYDSDTSSYDSRSRSRRRRRAANKDLTFLRDRVRQTKRAAFAEGTWGNLRTHLRTYMLFCTFYGLPPFPSTVDTLETYAEFLSRSFRAPASIANYISGIKTFHILFGLDTAAFSSMDLALVLRGLKKQMGHTPRQKLPFTPEVLLKIHEQLDTSDSFQATIWTVILLSFFTFQRKSNFVSKHEFDPAKQFTMHDFAVHRGVLLIRIRWSKTLQCAERVLYVPVMEIKNSPLCPVSAYCNMVKLNRNFDTIAAFTRPHRSGFVPLTQSVFDKAFKQILIRAG